MIPILAVFIAGGAALYIFIGALISAVWDHNKQTGKNKDFGVSGVILVFWPLVVVTYFLVHLPYTGMQRRLKEPKVPKARIVK